MGLVDEKLIDWWEQHPQNNFFEDEFVSAFLMASIWNGLSSKTLFQVVEEQVHCREIMVFLVPSD